MDIFEIHAGCKVGRWTVIAPTEKGKGGVKRWLCRCECGTERIVMEYKLTHGKSKSCGCYRNDMKKKNALTRDPSTGRNTHLYQRWANIKYRCCNPNSKDWDNYGGRGITICEEWKNSFPKFKEWAEANGYDDKLQIDRIDNDKGYSPDNCRFISPKDNSNNRRSSIRAFYNGEEMTVAEIAEITGIPWPTLYKHIANGSVDEYVSKRTGNFKESEDKHEVNEV